MMHIFSKLLFKILKNYMNFIRIKIEKVENLVTNSHKADYVVHIRKLNASIKSWISFEKSL